MADDTTLEMAERHVREGAEHIARQKAIIAELESDGHTGQPLQQARELLRVFEETREQHIQHVATERTEIEKGRLR